MDKFSTKLAPRTKDEKHELVFPEDFSKNHGCDLRAALESRIILEILNLNPREAEELNKHYKLAYMYPYDFVKDPFSFLQRISIPYVGKISPDRDHPTGNDMYCEGDSFLPPYEPLFRQYNAETFPIFSSDSFGGVNKQGVHLDTRLHQYVPELKNFKNIADRVSELSNNLEILNSGCGGGDIPTILGQEELTQSLREYCLFNIYISLAISREIPHSDFYASISSGFTDDFERDGIKMGCASKKLRDKIAQSAEALCLEYLSEVGTLQKPSPT
jgi:hypothetical protein